MTAAIWHRSDKATGTKPYAIDIGIVLRAAQGFGLLKEMRAGSFETPNALYVRQPPPQEKRND